MSRATTECCICKVKNLCSCAWGELYAHCVVVDQIRHVTVVDYTVSNPVNRYGTVCVRLLGIRQLSMAVPALDCCVQAISILSRVPAGKIRAAIY